MKGRFGPGWRAMLGFLLALGAAPAGTRAEEARAVDSRTAGWSFSLTPYGWFASIGGNLRLPGPAGRQAPVDASFSNILADVSAVPVMLMGELRQGRFGVWGDVLFLGLDQRVSPRDPSFVSGTAGMDTTIVNLIGFWRVLERDGQRLDLGGGLRIWNFDTSLTLQAGSVTSRTASRGLAWADPVIAARYSAALTPRLGVTLQADIGGFDLGSILTWQAIGTLDYRLSERWSLSAGWRYLAVDRKLTDTRIDVGFNGPLLSATYRF